ncbi:PKD domain-containing protein [Dysgonomonas sp. 511]|uniref:PKD domain-containing protein n=1 Tax=Dysgonomonas sp. 511 TaxID=2302930 RepID=UPI0013D04C59|nr:PKD domain-containing protein [Dysgonomonas sp. 511]NDV78477.1 PKD domain-containing protein [Dysgonomonas sp. 511]
MGKLLNHRIYIVFISILFVLAITFFVRSCMYDKEIEATVDPLEVELGSPISFSDSTRGAEKWCWEFGDTAITTSYAQRGQHIYDSVGRYKVRLTVNNNMQKTFTVSVRRPKRDESLELIKIIGPTEALVDEYITFRGEGSSKEWRWMFGETGHMDAFEKTTICQYKKPGRYIVKLYTEEIKYPIEHIIDIIPLYSEEGAQDNASVKGNDIKEHLQAIVDQKSFNTHYNHIKTKYLCGNPNALVIVNNNKKNDFYSYCQGLKIIGKNKVIIEDVLIDVKEAEEGVCVTKLIVIQTDL